jgi:hypothetical protein
VDFSVSSNVSNPGTVALNYLADSLDDVAPLVGPGAAPITTATVQTTGLVGDLLQDTAHVSGLAPTGTVSFRLYGPSNLNAPVGSAANLVFTSGPIPLDAAGNATSPP